MLHLHVVVVDRPVQGGFVAPELAVGNGLQLDGIQCVGHGILDAVVASQLRLESVLADLGIGIISQIANGGQVDGLAAVGHGDGGGQKLLHIAPGIAAGQAQLGSDGFADAGKKFLKLLKKWAWMKI